METVKETLEAAKLQDRTTEDACINTLETIKLWRTINEYLDEQKMTQEKEIEETQKAKAATAAITQKAEGSRPRYKDYEKLMRTFKPGDNISILLKDLEQMWADDGIFPKDRESIFRKCVSGEIAKVFETLT